MSPRSLHVPALLALPLILATCNDPAGPCEREFACQVTGVDLYIAELKVIATERDAGTGLGVVDGNPVEVDFTVRNRGDSISAPSSLALRFGFVPSGMPDSTLSDFPGDTVTIPPLRPGESYAQRASFHTWELKEQPRPASVYDDRSFGVAELLDADRDTTNNRRRTPSVHVRVAVLDMNLAIQDTALWVGQPFPVHLTIANASRHGSLPTAAVGFWLCRLASPWHCDVAGDLGFGTHDMPAIPAGGRYERDLTLTVPSAAGSQLTTAEYIVIIKVASPGTRDSLLWQGGNWIRSDGPRVRLHPDYRACQPPVLVANQPATAPLVCRNPRRFFVYELNARTDREYSIEQPDNPGATVYRREGTKVLDMSPGSWYRFSEPGTYWITDAVPSQYPSTTRTVVLRERSLN